MYLSRLQTKGFRALDNFSIEFDAGINVIVGPNNAGKTALVEAIWLALSGFNSPYKDIVPVHSPTLEDLWHSVDGSEREDQQFEIILDLGDIPDPNTNYADWMIQGHAPRLARVSVIGRIYKDKPKTVWKVGQADMSPRFEDIERVHPIFLPPLRDAENALRPGRNSHLAKLIQQIAKADPTKIEDIEKKFKDIQNDLIKNPPFSEALKRINERLLNATGHRYTQLSEMEFVDPKFKRISESLQMKIGLPEMLAYSLSENGLGYNNLLYIAIILSQLSEDSDRDLRLLLIEEPEAHLHPQMQQVLSDALIAASSTDQPEGRKQSQVILTTHSPLLAAHFLVDKIIVLQDCKVEPEKATQEPIRSFKGKPLARNIGKFGLDTKSTEDLSRYLDSTKANLFFANGVILVEGIAESVNRFGTTFFGI